MMFDKPLNREHHTNLRGIIPQEVIGTVGSAMSVNRIRSPVARRQVQCQCLIKLNISSLHRVK